MWLRVWDGLDAAPICYSSLDEKDMCWSWMDQVAQDAPVEVASHILRHYRTEALRLKV